MTVRMMVGAALIVAANVLALGQQREGEVEEPL